MLSRLFTPRGSEERDLSYQQIWGSGVDVSTLTTWSGSSISQQNSHANRRSVRVCASVVGHDF
jgi:hypothetical protein